MLKLSGPSASVSGLCLVNPNPQAVSRITNHLPKHDQDWNDWIDCIESQNVESQTYTGVNKLRLDLPKRIRERLDRGSQESRLYNRVKRESLKKLLQKINDAKISVILLKSDAVAQEIFADADYMSMQQVSLLFKNENREKVYKIYQELEFSNLYLNELELLESSQSMCRWPQFFNKDLTLRVETHWQYPISNALNSIFSEDLWERAQKVTFIGIPIYRLSNEDFIHHLCLDINLYDCKLSSISELYNCLIIWNKLDWNLFLKIISEANSIDAVYSAFTLSQSVYHIDYIQSFLDLIKNKVNPERIIALDVFLENPEFIMSKRSKLLSQIQILRDSFHFEKKRIKKLSLTFQILSLTLKLSTKEASLLVYRPYPQTILDRIQCYYYVYKVLFYWFTKWN